MTLITFRPETCLLICLDFSRRWCIVGCRAGDTASIGLGGIFRAALFTAKGISLRINRFFGDFAAGKIHFKVDLCRHVAGTDNRANKGNHTIAIDILKADPVFKL